MRPDKYKHIIWDWNGTLLNDAWLCVDVMNQSLIKRRLPLLTLAKYQDYFEFPVENYYLKLGFDFSKEPFSKAGTEFFLNYEKRKFECTLQKDAISALTYFKEKNISQSILSAYKQTSLTQTVSHYNLTCFFENIVGLDDHYARSKVDTGSNLLKKIPHARGEILFIGDTFHDFEVAKELHIDSILFLGNHTTREKLEQANSPIIENLANLINLDLY